MAISGTTSSTTSNRVSGLATGMDTEALVKSLTAATRTKIEKIQQQKQALLWKQEAYRAISKSVTDFKTKYFQSWSSSSVLNAGFFKQTSVTSSDSSYITATANADVSAGEIVIGDITSLASAQKMTSSSAISKKLEINVDPSTLANLSGKSMKITLDGVAREITFSTKTYDTASDVAAELQTQLDNAFGTSRMTVAADGNTLQIASPGSEAALGTVGRTGEEASDVIAFSDGQTNRISTAKMLSELPLAASLNDPVKFVINSVSFEFSKDKTLAQVMEAVNNSTAGVKMSYSSVSDKMTITAKNTGSGNNIGTADVDGSNFMASMFGVGIKTAGTNAELTINGENVVRSSNTFTIDGVKYNLLGKAAGTTAENITLNASLNVDAIVTGIKAFVDSYNTLISDVSTKLSEERNRDYQALTEDQEADMSETDITKWNEKAKSGWLRNDPTLQKMLAGMRSALFSDVKQVDSDTSLGINLSSIGIKTGAYTDGGKLEVDEAALRTALETKPDAVIKLFTQKSSNAYSSSLTSAENSKRNGETGLGWRLSEIIDANVRTTRDTAGKKGQLLEIAGITGDVSEFKNSIYTQLAGMNRSIDTQNDRLTAQEDRLYKQYAAMESAISKMNQQSTWLTQQTSSTN